MPRSPRSARLLSSAAALLLAAAAFAFAAAGRAATPPPTVTADIVYGEAAGQKLLLDASVPAGPGPFPVAILVHGGGWRRGDKARSPKPDDNADISPWFETLNEAKFTWFSINYRHAPAHRWPACYEDVLTAIRWVKAHAADYKGDPARIALFGHSAGGHLVCLAGTRPEADTRVAAIVGFAAVTDMVPLPNAKAISNNYTNLFGIQPAITPDSVAILRAASPLHQVKPGLPPFLLLHGEDDPGVPIGQAQALREKLRAAGNTCDLFTIRAGTHPLAQWDDVDPGYRGRLVAWLRRTLGKPGDPKP
jgi:alpha-L-fucosidase 2